MILLLIPQNKDSKEIKKLDEEEEKKKNFKKNLVDKLNILFKEIIEHRANCFKQTIEEYVRERLFAELNVILQVVQKNYQNNISNAFNEISQKSNLDNNEYDDIAANVFDFSISFSDDYYDIDDDSD